MDVANSDTYLGLLVLSPILMFGLWIFYRLFRKAGRSGWWALLMIVPGLNIVVLWVFAFIRWAPAETVEAERTTEIFS